MFDEYGYFMGEIPELAIRACSQPGDVSNVVYRWVAYLGFEVPRERAIHWLSQFGAWEFSELGLLDDFELACKVFWIACCDLNETGEWFGLVE